MSELALQPVPCPPGEDAPAIAASSRSTFTQLALEGSSCHREGGQGEEAVGNSRYQDSTA